MFACFSHRVVIHDIAEAEKRKNQRENMSGIESVLI